MAGQLINQVDRWLFEEYRTDVSDLALYRRFYAAMAFVLYFPHAMWAAGIPAHFWKPPVGPAMLLDGPPSWWALAGLNALLLLFCIALFVGDNTPVASLGVGLTIIALNCIAYSFGKIDHDILFPMAAILLAFSGWGARRSLDSDKSTPAPQRPWCLALLALVAGIAMFTAAWPKLQHGWLSLDTQAVKATAISYAALPNDSIGREAALQLTPDWLWEAQDWAAVVMEFAFVVTAFRLRWFRAALLVALLFHMGVLLVLDIAFAGNVVVYAAFFPVRRLVKPALANLPLAGLMTLSFCELNSPRDFVAETIVMLGGLLAAGYLASLPWKR